MESCENLEIQRNRNLSKFSSSPGKVNKHGKRSRKPAVPQDPAAKRSNSKYNEIPDKSDHDICRFCLEELKQNQIEINDLVEKRYFQLTRTKLRSSSFYSKFVCQLCYENLKNSIHFKFLVMNNQKKLYLQLEALESDTGASLDEVEMSDGSNASDALKFETVQKSVTEESCAEIPKLEEMIKEELLEDDAEFDLHSPPEIPKSPQKTIKKPRKRKNDHIAAVKKTNEYTKKPPRAKCGSKVCQICGKIFNCGKNCRTHYERVHLQIRNYSCDLCSYRCYTKGHLRIHMSGHIRDRIYKCHQCDKAFHRIDILKTHLACTHSTERSYVCQRPDCMKTFKTSSALNCHYQYIHKEEKKFRCDICQYVAYSNYQLTDHKRIHNAKPEIVCNQCGHLFFKLRQLREHVRRTHEEPKYTCQSCGQKFFLLQQLKTHFSSSHSGQRDFPCSYCDKSYFKNANLNRHIMHFHMKLKLYCEIPNCNSQFARKETYKNHILSHHKELDENVVKVMVKKIHDMKQEVDQSTFKLNFLRS